MKIYAWLCIAASLLAQQEPAPTPAPAQKDDTRTQLNLLGQTDSKSGESRRNENVQFNLIDNNALKEINQRLGVTPTVQPEFQPERNYYGSEFGTPPGSNILAVPKPGAPAWHAALNWATSTASSPPHLLPGWRRPARAGKHRWPGR